ncbi:hypothetical protein VFPFJ_02285 [Purpureocillium lilacinum]|uniref:Uncharacterized protein n=1 Tax=Purpureocillium lilacinum TaxID=33203 RepID=A0A179GMW6_PURLI|nr:hypothetical protein VFPFJ_02285 [Purpureocillium lilacinum]OAQ79122.1 hypothetical protein VFPBJ_07243 [Purpureocillium lilacinum]OAQ93124.1 hypothetical protein VFPFJ_02285 [Purpureocillium lilacinum]
MSAGLAGCDNERQEDSGRPGCGCVPMAEGWWWWSGRVLAQVRGSRRLENTQANVGRGNHRSIRPIVEQVGSDSTPASLGSLGQMEDCDERKCARRAPSSLTSGLQACQAAARPDESCAALPTGTVAEGSGKGGGAGSEGTSTLKTREQLTGR